MEFTELQVRKRKEMINSTGVSQWEKLLRYSPQDSTDSLSSVDLCLKKKIFR